MVLMKHYFCIFFKLLIFLSDARSSFPLLFDPSLWRQGLKHFSQLLQL
jgi:hypothetical protein